MDSTGNDNDDSRPPKMRVLALDGGGVRALSSLLVLRDLVERVGVKRGLTIPSNLRPSECFDLIIGTGTGGLSALFLGRLRMTVGEAIEEYARLAETAFKPSTKSFAQWVRGKEPLLDGETLENAIGYIVEKYLGNLDASLEDPPDVPTTCRTAVLAATEANIDAPPYIFRSYTTAQPASPFTIREVARATISATGLCPPCFLGYPPLQFIDAGSVGYNNPTAIGLEEGEGISPCHEVDCLVSIGTGIQKITKIGGTWDKAAEAFSKIVHSCEWVHNVMFHTRQPDDYFRFNVDRGLEAVDILEWSEVVPRGDLAGVTDAYLRWAEVINRLDSCAIELNASHSTRAKHGIEGVLHSTVIDMKTTVEDHYRIGIETHSQLQQVETRMLRLENSFRVNSTGQGPSQVDEDGIFMSSRKDFRLVRQILHRSSCVDHRCKVTLYEAESTADGRKVLVKTYESSQSSVREKAFLLDFSTRKSMWNLLLPELFGASGHSHSVPFQVYHHPNTELEPFDGWYSRTYHGNMVETICGLYDMRTSIKDLLLFGKERSISFPPSRVWKSLVKVQPSKTGTKYSLLFVGGLINGGERFYDPSMIVREYRGFSCDLYGASNLVAAFCGACTVWAEDDRRLEDAIELGAIPDETTLACALLDMGWLAAHHDYNVHTKGNILPGDVGYVSAHGVFEVIANVHTYLTSGDGGVPAWKSTRTYSFSFEYCYKDIDEKQAWKVLQRRASEIIANTGVEVAPHDLKLILSARWCFGSHLRHDISRSRIMKNSPGPCTGDSELDADPTESIPGYYCPPSASKSENCSSDTEITTPPNYYAFEDLGSPLDGDPGAPQNVPRLRLSFDLEPEWLDNETAYEETRDSRGKCVHAQRHGFTLESHTSYVTEYIKLPPGVALPYITEVNES